MIGRLRGTLVEKQPPSLLVEVAGVGYWVQSPLSTVLQTPEVGQEVVLRTHLVVREEALLLFGFATEAELDLFQALLRMNGVGPRMALAILSNVSPQAFASMILQKELTPLKKVPGIGTKMAQRLLVEMPDRLPLSLRIGSKQEDASAPQEAVQALVSLGYKQREAVGAIQAVKDKTMSLELLIKEALQQLAKV